MTILATCCGTDWTRETCAITQEVVHRVARCPLCQRWFTNLPGPVTDYLMPFGKYKGALVVDLWTTDQRYCEWLLTLDWIKPRLRQVLEETRP